jgi:hypothetical protein
LKKYYVDEIYGALIVKPLLAFSKYVLGGVDLLLAGIAWLLAGIASIGGMILQRWQSGNLRSYAAWLAAGAAAVLLFLLLTGSPHGWSLPFFHSESLFKLSHLTVIHAGQAGH